MALARNSNSEEKIINSPAALARIFLALTLPASIVEQIPNEINADTPNQLVTFEKPLPKNEVGPPQQITVPLFHAACISDSFVAARALYEVNPEALNLALKWNGKTVFNLAVRSDCDSAIDLFRQLIKQTAPYDRAQLIYNIAQEQVQFNIWSSLYLATRESSSLPMASAQRTKYLTELQTLIPASVNERFEQCLPVIDEILPRLSAVTLNRSVESSPVARLNKGFLAATLPQSIACQIKEFGTDLARQKVQYEQEQVPLFHAACISSSWIAVRALYQFDPAIINYTGTVDHDFSRMPLSMAYAIDDDDDDDISAEKIEIINFLWTAGAAFDPAIFNPLLFVLEQGNFTKALELLQEEKIDVVSARNGMTALDYAAGGDPGDEKVQKVFKELIVRETPWGIGGQFLDMLNPRLLKLSLQIVRDLIVAGKQLPPALQTLFPRVAGNLQKYAISWVREIEQEEKSSDFILQFLPFCLQGTAYFPASEKNILSSIFADCQTMQAYLANYLFYAIVINIFGLGPQTAAKDSWLSLLTDILKNTNINQWKIKMDAKNVPSHPDGLSLPLMDALVLYLPNPIAKDLLSQLLLAPNEELVSLSTNTCLCSFCVGIQSKFKKFLYEFVSDPKNDALSFNALTPACRSLLLNFKNEIIKNLMQGKYDDYNSLFAAQYLLLALKGSVYDESMSPSFACQLMGLSNQQEFDAKSSVFNLLVISMLIITFGTYNDSVKKILQKILQELLPKSKLCENVTFAEIEQKALQDFAEEKGSGFLHKNIETQSYCILPHLSDADFYALTPLDWSTLLLIKNLPMDKYISERYTNEFVQSCVLFLRSGSVYKVSSLPKTNVMVQPLFDSMFKQTEMKGDCKEEDLVMAYSSLEEMPRQLYLALVSYKSELIDHVKELFETWVKSDATRPKAFALLALCLSGTPYFEEEKPQSALSRLLGIARKRDGSPLEKNGSIYNYDPVASQQLKKLSDYQAEWLRKYPSGKRLLSGGRLFSPKATDLPRGPLPKDASSSCYESARSYHYNSL